MQPQQGTSEEGKAVVSGYVQKQSNDITKRWLRRYCMIAGNYFKDGCIDLACPPLKALLHIMVDGTYEGKTITDPEVRNLFDREAVLASDWYQARLDAKVIVEQRLVAKKIAAVKEFETLASYEGERTRLKLAEKLAAANERAARYQTTEYRKSLIGTIGTDPALLNS